MYTREEKNFKQEEVCMTETKGLSVKTIAAIGMITAVTCILAPLSIPIGPVPISLTNLVIYFGLYILG